MDSQVILSYTFSGTIVEIIFVLIVFTVINITFHIVVAIKQQRMISKQQNMLEAKEDFIGMMAAKQHEFNKHIQMINGLAERDSQKSAELIKKYTDELIERNNSSSERVFYVGDSLLSAYLTRKAAEAKEKEIELSILIMDIADKLPCGSTEMVEIIGNLLDNAFEAVTHMGANEKKVFLEAHDDGKKIVIQTMNPIPGNIEPGKEQSIRRGFSTKKGRMRGHGLANVNMIAEKYKGSVNLYTNGEVVTVIVAMPMGRTAQRLCD